LQKVRRSRQDRVAHWLITLATHPVHLPFLCADSSNAWRATKPGERGAH
jgi:hypothetical protein